jgi:hypothetical protein
MTTPIDLSRLVAPLVWVPFGQECLRAESAIGRYEIMWGFHNGQTFLDVPAPMRRHVWHHTIEAAKAAAQADYAARIIAALNPAAITAMLAEARNDALREAAAKAQNRWAIRKEHADHLYEMDYPEAKIDSRTVSAQGDEAEMIAAEIRALIDKEPQT